MVSGGPRIRSGSPPDPNALRRERDGKEWINLPRSGRAGDPPEWPIETSQPSVAEVSMWARLWRKPQAILWEADGAVDLVALYVRAYLEAMEPFAPHAARTSVRQYAEMLLLTDASLVRAKVVINPDEMIAARRGAPAPAHARATGTTGSASGIRGRLNVVPPPPEGNDE